MQDVTDGIGMTRMMIDQFGERPAEEWDLAVRGRRVRNGMREYVFHVAHQQVGKFEFSYAPDYPEMSDRISVERV